MVMASLNKLKSALPVLKDINTGISKKDANPPVIKYAPKNLNVLGKLIFL